MQAMDTRKREFGADHSDTLDIMSSLAEAYWRLSLWGECGAARGADYGDLQDEAEPGSLQHTDKVYHLSSYV